MGILKELAQILASYTAELETYGPEDLRDPKKYFGDLYLLQSQSQALIDMALRAAALLGASPSGYIDAGRKLKEKSVLTEEDYRVYADMVRFRNILVHYMMVKEEVVREIVERGLYRWWLSLRGRYWRPCPETPSCRGAQSSGPRTGPCSAELLCGWARRRPYI
jgi:uncharacterized protein YutE (UPF0331/DUF86 family)